jgi:hypothetical protein
MRSSTPSARVLPDPVEGHRCAAANAPGSSRRRPRPSLAFNFQLHEPLGGKADHLAQQIGIWGLLHERVQVYHIVGDRRFLGCAGVSQPDPTGELPVTTAQPPARYGAISAFVHTACLAVFTNDFAASCGTASRVGSSIPSSSTASSLASRTSKQWRGISCSFPIPNTEIRNGLRSIWFCSVPLVASVARRITGNRITPAH